MFAVIGIAILDIVITIMRSLTTLLRESQTFGYAEVLFISNINPLYLFFCSSIYPFLKGVVKFIFYVVLLYKILNLGVRETESKLPFKDLEIPFNTEINFPIVINGDKYPTLKTTLKIGTPYVQIIPFKRDNWKCQLCG